MRVHPLSDDQEPGKEHGATVIDAPEGCTSPRLKDATIPSPREFPKHLEFKELVDGEPQLDGCGRKRYATHWGIRRDQLCQLLLDLRDDPSWRPDNDMYTFVNEYVKPWTAGTGRGWALEKNKDEPLEVNKMVSHTWAEQTEELLESVIRSTADGDVMFICTLALYQCEDGAGPTIQQQIGTNPDKSPFRVVLDNIFQRHSEADWIQRWYRQLEWLPSALALIGAMSIYSVPTFEGHIPDAYGNCRSSVKYVDGWGFDDFLSLGKKDLGTTQNCPVSSWVLAVCAAAFLVAAAACSVVRKLSLRAGRMLVVPTRNIDLYSRLWCVYEIFAAYLILQVPVDMARSLARAGKVSSANATCSSEDDLREIRADILSRDDGFDGVDDAVREVTRQAKKRLIIQGCRSFPLLIVLCMGSYRLQGLPIWYGLGGIIGAFASCANIAFAATKLKAMSNGVVRSKKFLRLIAFCLVVATLTEAWIRVLKALDIPWFTIYVDLGYLVGGLHGSFFWLHGMAALALGLCLALDSTSRCFRESAVWFMTLSVFLALSQWMLLVFVIVMGYPWYVGLVFSLSLPFAASFWANLLWYTWFDFGIYVEGDKAEPSRRIRPTSGVRLVYLWRRTLWCWTPLPPLPVSARFPGDEVPDEMKARGLGADVWRKWIRELADLRRRAWRDPRTWAYSLWLASGFFAFTWLLPPAGALIGVLMWCLPCGRWNRYQVELRRWLDGFNETLRPLGMSVKAQTLCCWTAEVSYLSFALTPEESLLLQEEPIFHTGDCISKQGHAARFLLQRDSPACWGRVV